MWAVLRKLGIRKVSLDAEGDKLPLSMRGSSAQER